MVNGSETEFRQGIGVDSAGKDELSRSGGSFVWPESVLDQFLSSLDVERIKIFFLLVLPVSSLCLSIREM